MGRIGVTLTIGLLFFLVLAPVGTMVIASLTVGEVRLVDGRVYRGPITIQSEKKVEIKPRSTGRAEEFPRHEVESVGPIFGLDNYEGLLSGKAEQLMFKGTIALAAVSTLLAVLLGLPLGLLLGAYRVPGRAIWEILLTLPLVLPPILVAIGTFHDLADFQPAFLRAAIVFALTLYPLVMLFTSRALRGIGADALDAARLHASPREALFRVVLGPALPGTAAGALLVFVFVISDFAVPDFLGVTTAENTIVVYANAVFGAWMKDFDAGRAAAIGMPVTMLALIGFALVLWIERRRGVATMGGDFEPPRPLPLARRGRWVALGALTLVVIISVLWPLRGHADTAAGKHFGSTVSQRTQRPPGEPVDPRSKPSSLLDGLQRGVKHQSVDRSAWTSVRLGVSGALIAVLLALLATEAGRGRPWVDRILLLTCFLPVAVPSMSFAVGWMEMYGTKAAQGAWKPVLLLAARLLPFVTLAVRAVRLRLDDELLEAGAVAGLGPVQRFVRITLPLMLPGIALGFLLGLLFGLREVDAIVFTRTGTQTLPVHLYNMIHYGFDVQVAALSILWTAGVALLLLIVALLAGSRFRLLP